MKKLILVLISFIFINTAHAECLSKKQIYVDIFFYKHNSEEIFYKDFLGNDYINFFCLKKPKRE